MAKSKKPDLKLVERVLTGLNSAVELRHLADARTLAMTIANELCSAER